MIIGGDILEITQFRLVNNLINDLLNEIRPDCIALTDSFDFNDYLLKSTIGRFDGNIYEALVEAAFSSTLNKKEVFDGYEEFLKPHLNKKILSRGNDLRDLKEKF